VETIGDSYGTFSKICVPAVRVIKRPAVLLAQLLFGFRFFYHSCAPQSVRMSLCLVWDDYLIKEATTGPHLYFRCQTAVTGCPEAQANHAVIMARFAADCMVKMKQISKELTVTLGPDTADLSMRFGKPFSLVSLIST
jgi:hypothetical protein